MQYPSYFSMIKGSHNTSGKLVVVCPLSAVMIIGLGIGVGLGLGVKGGIGYTTTVGALVGGIHPGGQPMQGG
jgi:hypothetical protein